MSGLFLEHREINLSSSPPPPLPPPPPPLLPPPPPSHSGRRSESVCGDKCFKNGLRETRRERERESIKTKKVDFGQEKGRRAKKENS